MVIATVTVFLSETHVEFFEPHKALHVLDHHPSLLYNDILIDTKSVIEQMGFTITNEYFEYNEFEDPIQCYFIRKGQ